MAARSIWNGTLALGEVTIPVKLFSLVSRHRVQFREVRLSDASPIRHQRVGSESGEEVPAEQIRKAYEREDGRTVVLSDADIASVQAPRTKVIEIEHFTHATQIDPVYYERPYVLGAQPGGERAYALLRAALARSNKVGIGRFVLRTREQLVTVASQSGALRLYTMRFADELVSSAELQLPAMAREPSAKEAEMAQRLIDALLTHWEPARFKDRHREAVLAVIERKAEGHELTLEEPKVPEPAPDLMAALTKSVEQSRKRRRAPAGARRKTPPKAPAGKRTRTRSS